MRRGILIGLAVVVVIGAAAVVMRSDPPPAPAIATVIAKQERSASSDTHSQSEGGLRHITFKVIATGQPISGAVIRLFAQDAKYKEWQPAEAEVTTASDGTAIAAVNHEQFLVVAHAAGLAQLQQFIDGRETREFTLTFVPGSAISGQIRFVDGRPASHAQFQLTWTEDGFLRDLPSGESLSGQADADGRFTTPVLTDGKWVIDAKVDGAARAERWFTVPAKEPVDLELRTAAVLAGQVVDEHDRPVSNAEVIAVHVSGLAEATETEKDGTFAIEVQPGFVKLKASATDKTGAIEAPFLASPETPIRGVTLRLGAPGRICGHVRNTDDGAPISRATVGVFEPASRFKVARGSENATEAREDGSFCLEDLGPGEYKLLASAPHHHSWFRTIVLGQGQSFDVTASLLSCTTFVVRTLFEDRPIAGVPVKIGERNEVSDERGEARFECLHEETVDFPLSLGGGYSTTSNTIRVPHRADARQDVLVTRKEPAGESSVDEREKEDAPLLVAGSVVTIDGSDPGAWISVRDSEGFFASGNTDPFGHFSIHGRSGPDAKLRVEVHSLDRPNAEVDDIPAGSRDVVITLASHGSISGDLEGAGANDVSEVCVHRECMSVMGSHFFVSRVAEGDVDIEATNSDGRVARARVHVMPATTTRISLGFGDPATVRGRIINRHLSGRVVVDLEPLNGGETTVAECDEQGRFVSSELAPGRYLLSVYAEGGHIDLRVELKSGERKDLGDLKLQASGVAPGLVGLGLANASSGVRVERVFSPSPAETAGVRTGDVITAVDGTPVSTVDSARALLIGQPGSVVTLSINRAGTTLTIVVDRQR